MANRSSNELLAFGEDMKDVGRILLTFNVALTPRNPSVQLAWPV